MGQIVAAMSTSHAPGLLSLPDAPPKDQQERMYAALAEMRNQLDKAKPDVIIAFLDDHFENYFRFNTPTFAVGTSPENMAPPERSVKWLKTERRPILNDPEYAEAIISGCIAKGIDVTRSGQLDLGHNLLAPMQYIRPEYDIPVVPVFINVFTRPLPTCSRAYELGEAIREVIEKRPEKVALFATGGLSHWPPTWYEESDKNDEFLERRRQFQTEGKPYLLKDPNISIDTGKREDEMVSSGIRLINEEWDREILSAFERGDVDYFKSLTNETIEKGGGNGGQEIKTWVAVMGALKGAKCRVLNYEPAAEWICGMGFISYDHILNA